MLKISVITTTTPRPKNSVTVRFDERADAPAAVLAREDGGEVLILKHGAPSSPGSTSSDASAVRRAFVRRCRHVITVATHHRLKVISVTLSDLLGKDVSVLASAKDAAELCATAFVMAAYHFRRFKKTPPEGFGDVHTVYVRVEAEDLKEITASVRRGSIIAHWTNVCRDLSNTPGGDMTPRLLAAAAMRHAKESGARATILDEKAIARLKMGGILGVARGSAEKPRFIIVEHRGGKKKQQPIVIVGKGITFDTGGINLKPTEGISDMHLDMSGGAAAVSAVCCAAQLKLPLHVIALVPAVENMPSGESYRPGDILTAVDGTTIEVGNTDAEGRIILADALLYAARYKPSLVVDVATLTGAAMVALGAHASALFATDEAIAEEIVAAAAQSADSVWRLPLWDEYTTEIRGTVGDWSNIGKTRWGGAIHAAAFLRQFAKGYPWAHLDIAPRMTAVEGENLAKGASGAGVRLLVELLRRRSDARIAYDA